MTTVAEERVEAGVAWLNEVRPGWVDEVDLDTFDIADPDACIAGQLDLWNRPEFNGLGPYVHFCESVGMINDYCERVTNEELTAAWVAKIRELRGLPGAVV